MKTIKLTQNQVALVDPKLYPFLSRWKWHAAKLSGKFYAAKAVPLDFKGERKRVMYMHHLVAGHPIDNLEIDHINGNGLDNRRKNLRLVSHAINQANRKEHRLGHIIGTSYNKRVKKWVAQLWIGKKREHLGYFTSQKDAASCFQAFRNSHPK